MKVPVTVRATVHTRDAGKCARCGRSVLNYPSSVHHRLPRRMGGTRDIRSYDPRNLVLVCGTGTTGCHEEIESNRTVAYDTGWLLRSFDGLDDPLLTLDGRRVYLTEDGGRSEILDRDSMAAALDSFGGAS